MISVLPTDADSVLMVQGNMWLNLGGVDGQAEITKELRNTAKKDKYVTSINRLRPQCMFEGAFPFLVRWIRGSYLVRWLRDAQAWANQESSHRQATLFSARKRIESPAD